MNYPIPKQKPKKSSPSAATLKGEDGDGVSSTYPLDHGCKGSEWKTYQSINFPRDSGGSQAPLIRGLEDAQTFYLYSSR